MRLVSPPLTGREILGILKWKIFKRFGKPTLKQNNVNKHVKSKKRNANALSNKTVVKDDKADTRRPC